ncbi:hypothetical protein Slin15195_G116820 [Septoria linicola]|uniref:Uncharacterized protein n=1 Tax=Septoria linicola TaxID=215465 RepID=A0A9Q9B6I2_9PEZI|nr:hypothetical protein Slin14017_G093820 [Septoria linicola]USW58363.1 hypothetical protein Slin15195_G116820 [Septoria linicola]
MALTSGFGSSADDERYLISQGAFAPILVRGWQDVVSGYSLMPEGMDVGLSHLEYMLGLETMLPHERAACALAIEDLAFIHRELLVLQQQPQQRQDQHARGLGCSVASLVCWPRRDSSVFASIVQRRVPQALVIVSYYCVLLHMLDVKWWARAWGVRVLQDVLLNLEEAWKTWVQWPIQAIMYRETEATSNVASQTPAMELGLGAMLL